MLANLHMTHGVIFSQHVLLTLVEKGITREDAYALVQKNAMQSWEQGTDFKQLLLKDQEVMSRLKPQEIERIFRVKISETRGLYL